jgi:hypothetical protein
VTSLDPAAPRAADPRRSYADEEYDVFAVMDSVPFIVRELDKQESRFWSLLSAFIGVSSAYVGAPSADIGVPIERIGGHA